MPLRLERAACLKAAFTSSMVVCFSTCAVSSTIDTSGVGTRSEMPSIFPFTCGITRLVALAAPVVVGMMLSAAARARRRDRKSTRLNSSHSQISYAVFCLKKKNHFRHVSEELQRIAPADGLDLVVTSRA